MVEDLIGLVIFLGIAFICFLPWVVDAFERKDPKDPEQMTRKKKYWEELKKAFELGYLCQCKHLSTNHCIEMIETAEDGPTIVDRCTRCICQNFSRMNNLDYLRWKVQTSTK